MVLFFSLSFSCKSPLYAAEPGLPFTEDFNNTNLKDDTKTNANWSTDDQAVYLAWQKQIYGPMTDPVIQNISSDTDDTTSIALGDVDGDGDLDVVAGNGSQPNKLYLNNGSEFPFFLVSGTDIGSDTDFTHSIALGDVDNDGDLDLVTGKSSTNKLYLNNGTTNPFLGVSGTDIGSDTDTAISIALGDVNGDGRLDLVTGKSSTNKLYLNNGTTDPFLGVSGTDIGSDTDFTKSIALGDLDGDGNLDVVAGNGGQLNKLYLNNGSATDPFLGVSGTDIGSESHYTRSIALGDIDGDGDLDVVIGRNGPSRLYLNNGSADPFNFVSGTNIGISGVIINSIALGDVDNDGDLDVVEGNEGEANKLYLNNGSANPFYDIVGTVLSIDENKTFSIALGDVDNDGDLDVVEGNTDDANRLYLNNGNGNPFNGASGTDIGSDTDTTYSIALGDVNGDGHLDVVTGKTGINKLYLNNGTADPFLEVSGTDIGSDSNTTYSIALGDMDGDGDLDVVAGTSFPSTNKLYLNNGTTDPFLGVSGTDISSDGYSTESIALGDVNGDGSLDVVAGNSSSSTNKLYLNNGTADPFDGVSGMNISTDTDDTNSIALGDVDGDGDLDVVEGNGSTDKFYLNNGSTTDPFLGVSGTEISSPYNCRTKSIALGDINGDGHIDLVTASDVTTNRLYLNNGTTDPFLEVSGTDISSDIYDTLSIALGDVDGDGDLDVVIGNYDQTNKLYLNNGSSNPFSGVIVMNISTDMGNTCTIALGDVNGDDQLDVVTGGYDESNKLYLTSRSVIPVVTVMNTEISSDADTTHSIALGDVDSDGDLDVVAGNASGQLNKLYLNNGYPNANPFFGVIGTDISSDTDSTSSIALGDINGDGDLDVVAGNYGQSNKLYLNNGSTNDPFFGVSGTDISSDTYNTNSIALGDVNSDGFIDVISGNQGTNRLYLNNGTADPFLDVSGTDISSDTDTTHSIILGDVNGDGHIDVIAGNSNANKLYLNNGTTNPFLGVSGTDIGSDTDSTRSIASGDVDGDGYLDVVAGNYGQPNKLYLNNGTTDPFNGVSGINIGTDTDSTSSIALGDVDGDGDLDVVAGSWGGENKLCLNNGTTDPFLGVISGTVISSIADDINLSITLGDVDGNGNLDAVAGNWGENNLYRLSINSNTLNPNYNTGYGLVVSTEVDTESIDNISHATLTSTVTLPLHTQIHYYLSNNGGERFFEVYPSQEFMFPTQGNDVRWKAELQSLSPVLTPHLSQIYIDTRNIAPEVTAGGELSYTEDAPPTPIDPSITVLDINDVNLEGATITISYGYQNGEDVLGFIDANGITGSWNAGSGQLTLSGTSSVNNYQAALQNVTYLNTSNDPVVVEDGRTIEYVVNDGEFNSTPVTSTVTVTRTNDPPQITDHDPDPAQIVQREPVIISMNTPPAPAGNIYLTVIDLDNTAQELSLIVQPGDNYSVLGNVVTPIENFFGELTVPAVVHDGIEFGNIYHIPLQVDDVENPVVSSVAVQVSGLTVYVAFSEPMGNDVLVEGNYTISGSGQGTLSVHPNHVSSLVGNIYELIWDSGEMKDGGDVTLTVSGVLDAAGNPMGTPASGTDVGGGIGTPPETGIDNGEGTYQSSVDVTLTCTDGVDGSGCSAIYYSLDGSDPALVYTDPITIDQDTTLRFFSEDAAGNRESVQTQIYSIEIPTTISCNLSESDITLGETFTISGVIDPHPNEANEGVSIELTPSEGNPIPISTDAAADGTFSKVVDCEILTSAGSWMVQTSWTGDESHLGADSPLTPLTVLQATTTLTLDVVAAEAIKVYSRPPIGGDFSSQPYCSSMNLSGIPITIYATEPDGGDIHILGAVTTNQFGQFLLDYDTAEGDQTFDFNVVGEWILSAEYAETDEFSGAATEDVIIRVVPTAGYAILVQGLVQSGEGAASHRKTASFVYDTLKDRQILDDDIQYLSLNIDDNWDGFPYKSDIQDAVTVWARDKMDPDFVHPIPGLDNQGQAGDLYIILIDHGWTDPLDDEEGVFYIFPDTPLTSTELGTWVSELQANLAGTVSADRNIVVILGFCRAGAFIDDLYDESFENRVVIASAAKDEASHRGPQDVDENGEPLRDGEYFVSEFFKSVSYGKPIRQCFEEAALLTEAFTSSGTGEINAPYYDDSIQHPLLNDNNDAVGSNTLSSEEGADGAASEYLFIGASPPAGNDPGDVLITKVNPAQFMGFEDSTVDLWAEVDDPNDLRLIWLEVKAPNYNPADPGAGLQIEMDTFKKATTEVDGSRYLWTAVGGGSDPADLFDIPGTYQVFYFAKDNDTGHVSPLTQSRVYKAPDPEDPEEGPNSPPYEFNLISPDNEASVLTTVILDWMDAEDPDEDSLTYTILLAKDDDQFTDPMFIEGLSDSAYLLSPNDGIEDLSTYYWKVQAIDFYGALRESSKRVFHTDNTNLANGYITGHVFDAVTNNSIANAEVTVGATTQVAAMNGSFWFGIPPGTYAVNISAPGYETAYPDFVIIDDGEIVTRDFALQPESPTDSDSDGLPDDLEDVLCTDTHDADTDDDGIMDGDEDSDHDGIVDPGETDPCDIDTDNDGIQDGTESGLAAGSSDTNSGIFQPDLDPASITDPLDKDTDDDGQADGEEDLNFNGRVDPGESDPTDPNSKRMKLMPWIPLLLLE